MSFAAKLKNAKKNWSAAKEKAAEFGQPLDDGLYQLQLTKAELGESQGSGKLQVALEYTVLEGELTGKTFREYLGIEDPERLPWFIRRLAELGYDADAFDITEAEAWCKDATSAGIQIMGQVRTKGDFQNLRIKELLESEAPAPVVTTSKKTSKKTSTRTAATEFQNGQRIEAKFGGDDFYPGVVTSAGADSCLITFDDGDEGDVPNADIRTPTPTVDEGPEPDGDWTPSHGGRVGVDIDGVVYFGTITSLPRNAKAAYVEFDDGDKQQVPVEELLEPEGDTPAEGDAEPVEDVGVGVGDRVSIVVKGNDEEGAVTAVDGDKVKVKLDSNKKVYAVSLDDVTMLA